MRTAEAGPAPAPAGTEEQLSRQYPKYYVVKGHLADMLGRAGPRRAVAARARLGREILDQPDHDPPGPARADDRGAPGADARAAAPLPLCPRWLSHSS